MNYIPQLAAARSMFTSTKVRLIVTLGLILVVTVILWKQGQADAHGLHSGTWWNYSRGYPRLCANHIVTYPYPRTIAYCH